MTKFNLQLEEEEFSADIDGSRDEVIMLIVAAMRVDNTIAQLVLIAAESYQTLSVE